MAERAGDIILNCTGGTPGASITTTLTLFAYGTVITNRVTSAGNTDLQVIQESTGGQQILNTNTQQSSPSSVTISGLTFIVPANGAVIIRISNLRVNAYLAADQPIGVNLASNSTSVFRVNSNVLIVAFPQRGLLSSYASTFVCISSPLPATITFSNLITTGSRFASVRVTEGQANSFEKRGPNSDAGTRIVARYSGLPAGARLFVPDFIAGSDATTPTAGGDLGLSTSGGIYTPGQGQLLLGRVRGTDTSGAGGVVPSVSQSAQTRFDSASEIDLSNGSGLAVFEVLDGNANIRESAQFPTFLGYAGSGNGTAASANVAISFGPISTDAQASTTAPVPRFQNVNPPSDCQTLGDCNSGIFPILSINSDSLNVTAFTNSAPQIRYVRINNEGGSLLNWTAAVTYKTGTNWLRIDPPSGLNNATIRIDYIPGTLPAGVYEATLTIDAGPIAGSRTANIRFEVTQFTPPVPLPPVISSVVNAATFLESPLMQGQIATIFGQRFAGTTVTLALDGIPARVFFSNDTQINFVVPETVNKVSAQAIVTVDGRASATKVVTFANASPGIFGILNQDYAPNTAATPALGGSVIQIFATGLPATGVTAKLAGDTITNLPYAGPAPGFAGLQQVNLQLPTGLLTPTVDVSLCAGTVCSPPVKVNVR